MAFLFNEKLIQMLHVYQKHRGRPAQSWFSLFSWELCLRNKSECLKIYKGCIDDLLRVPEGRINGAFYDKFGRLHFVMKKRKHRPRGSKLMITCRCAEVKHCLVCTFKPFLDKFQVGKAVWDLNASETLKETAQACSALGSQIAAKLLTWKSWRAGKATQLAKDGRPLGEIIAAGDWSRNSFSRYCDVDKCNRCTVLQETIDASDDEGDDD